MNGAKDYFDPAHRRVIADFASPSPSKMKDKIEFIRAAVPTAKRNDIVTVLQSCDYSVEAAIAALTKDGGREELEQWTVQGRKSKPRQGPAKRKKPASVRQSTPETTGVAVTKETVEETVEETVVAEPSKSEEEEKPVATTNGYSDQEVEVRPHHSRKDSVSSTGSSGSSNTNTSSKEGSKKLLKDLAKSTTQLSRYQTLHDENCQVAERRIKSDFERLRKCLADREHELLAMLSLVRSQGDKLLAGRHESAKKLRLLGESISLLSESAASDLRADIKHFLSERKIDEELAKMEWFSGSVDELEQEVQKLGKVPEIRHLYSERKVIASNPSRVPVQSQGHSSNSVDQDQQTTNSTVANTTINRSESTRKPTNAKVSDNSDDLRLQAELHAKLKQAVSQHTSAPTKQGSTVANGYVSSKPQSRPSHQVNKHNGKAQGKPPSGDNGGQARWSAKQPTTTSVAKEKPIEKRPNDVMKKDVSNPVPLPQRQRRQPRGGRPAQVDSAPLQGISHPEATRD